MNNFKLVLKDEEILIDSIMNLIQTFDYDARSHIHVEKLINLKTGATLDFNGLAMTSLINISKSVPFIIMSKVYKTSIVSDWNVLQSAYDQGLELMVIRNNEDRVNYSHISKVDEGLEFKDLFVNMNNTHLPTHFIIIDNKYKMNESTYRLKRGGLSKSEEMVHINKINEMIHVIKTDTKYHNVVNIIPECLKGFYGLTNIALFLQVTDKMEHTGFIYQGNYLRLDTKLISHRQVKNKVAILKSMKYSQQYASKSFPIDYIRDLYVPATYAEKADIEIYVNSMDDQMNFNDCDLEFSNSCGYYNSDTHIVIDHELYEKDDCVMLHNGNYCLDEDAVWIEDKDEYYLQSECVHTTTGWMLEDDATCINGTWYDRESDDLSYCDDCNETVLAENTQYHEGNNCTYCDDCYNNHNDKLERKDYSSNVLTFKGFGETSLFINKKPVYLGLEFEAIVNDNYSDIDNVNSFTNNNDYSISTKDGSLDDELGIEFIFRPEGLEQQKANVNDFIDCLSSSIGHSCLGNYDDEYGLHVHVSSHFLGYASKLKIQNFVSMNHHYFAEIGKRDETGYQKPKQNRFNELSDYRYNLVNIQPKDTIEFRFPAGIADSDHINLNLEMALSVTMFCKFCLSLTELKMSQVKSMVKYIKYVQSNKKQYPLLDDHFSNIDIDILTKSEIEAETNINALVA